jgi:hypothetical protein
MKKKLTIDQLIKKISKEVDNWPKWVKRNAEAVFGKKK